MSDSAPVFRRKDSRIVRDPVDEVQSIRTLLEDAYKNSIGGQTLMRELVQNADDAGAERLLFVTLDKGLPEAANSLLWGPTLLAVNDGHFSKADHDALHKAIGGAKARDVEKVGRFGLGLKSVFHLCEAVVYLGAGDGELRTGVLNPWAGTGKEEADDPLHPDWDKVIDADLSRIREIAISLLGEFRNGFLLWIPLRLDIHLDRARDQKMGLGQHCPTADDVAGSLSPSQSMALLLAQCGHLSSIASHRAVSPDHLDRWTTLALVERPDFQQCSWVGRHEDDSVSLKRSFRGSIQSRDQSWSVMGIDAIGSSTLRELRNRDDWQHDLEWRDGQCERYPRKALAHAAITVVRSERGLDHRCGPRIRWSVFLPLDDRPDPGPSQVVEIAKSGPMGAAWDILLHGYFSPSHDRRSIPGVTDGEAGVGDSAVRADWNRGVRDEQLLPLLPCVLEHAVAEAPADAARALIDAVATSDLARTNINAITKQNILLPVLSCAGIVWQAYENGQTRVLSVPSWSDAPRAVREGFMKRVLDMDAAFIDESTTRLGGEPATWSTGEFEEILSCISADTLRTTDGVNWAKEMVRHALGDRSDIGNELASAAAAWLSRRIGEGVLTPRAGDPSWEERHAAWNGLIHKLPENWIAFTPKGSAQAVAELAREGVLGPGLLTIPFGAKPGRDLSHRPELIHIDATLRKLGTLLGNASDGSQGMNQSRLVLAEALLSLRGDLNLGSQLGRLPLIRVLRLPEDKDEAWSTEELLEKVRHRRVFSRPARSDQMLDGSEERPSDPKEAARELAKALGKPVWLVDASVGRSAGAPMPTEEELSLAVLSSSSIDSQPEGRAGLLRRFGSMSADTERPDVRRAMRSLLTGRVLEPGCDTGLFYVRSGDSEAADNLKTLAILLRLLDLSWCAVQAELVDPLPNKLVDELGVTATDDGVMHKLLSDCLNGEVGWRSLQTNEILHLLRRLYDSEPGRLSSWKEMPLHRDYKGIRGPVDRRARRYAGTLRFPPELESEIRLLDPDKEVEDHYHHIKALDEDYVLQVMLESVRPSKYARDILGALQATADGRINLPGKTELLDLLRKRAWIPCHDGESGLAPANLLILPDQLEAHVVQLAESGCLGDLRLVRAIAPEMRESARQAAQEILGRPTYARQVTRLAEALRDSGVGVSDYLVLPTATEVDIELLDLAFGSPLVEACKGWKLLHEAAAAMDVTEGRFADATKHERDALVALGQSLCGLLDPPQQVKMLKAIAGTRPGKDTGSGILFRRLLTIFNGTEAFFQRVLPEITLPTQDGQWTPPAKIARSESGVSRSHLLLSDLRSALRLDSDDTPRHVSTSQKTAPYTQGTARALEKYFEPWVGKAPPGAVGAFLCLLYDNKDSAIAKLAQHWLGEDVSIGRVRGDLFGDGKPPAGIRTFYSGAVSRGTRFEVLNLLGQWVEMDAAGDAESIFATDPELLLNWRGDFWSNTRCDVEPGSARNPGQGPPLPFWSLNLRDVEPAGRTGHELIGLLGRAVEWWAGRVLKVSHQEIERWWREWGQGSQAQVTPVLASIRSHLPLTLNQLNVSDNDVLREALRKAERAQRRREQAPPAEVAEASEAERAALKELSDLISNDTDNQRFLWDRVQELMRRYGYAEESVLLELAQNADDALAQAAEIAGSPLPPEARQFLVQLCEYETQPTVDVLYHGRPINDTGGAAFAEGRDRRWDQDLYFMMLMNLSGKPGESPGQDGKSSTTGQFGLGFKAVHLVSEEPSVVSGFLAFSITGGLLPKENPVPDDPQLAPIAGHRPTRVRLPLRGDIDRDELIGSMFKRFKYARSLLPAFSRQIREVVVKGGPCPGVTAFNDKAVENAPGWSFSTEPVELPGHGQWRILRFRPAGAGMSSSTMALAVGLREGRPEPFPPDLPFLWNVTPTSEGWACGYAINGPLKLDPGRTHVSLDDEATLKVISLLGDDLGRGLMELEFALKQAETGSNASLLAGSDPEAFLESLWRVLMNGLDSTDTLRRELLLRLHADGRGVSAWMSAGGIIPSGLPAPFPGRLPRPDLDTPIEIATDGLDDPDVCEAMSKVEDLVQMMRSRHVVSSDVAARLRPILDREGFEIRQLKLSDVLAELSERWDRYLSPERLHALRSLAAGSAWKIAKANENGSPWYAGFRARSASGTDTPLDELLVPRHLPDELSGYEALSEELLQAGIAPDSRVLAQDYILDDSDLVTFRNLRWRHELSADVMVGWYQDLTSERRPAAIRYLLHGRLRDDILKELIASEALPQWLQDREVVEGILEDLEEEEWRSRALPAALFRDAAPAEPETDPAPELSESQREDFFHRLSEWWGDEGTRREVISKYERSAWPNWLLRAGIADGLRSGSSDSWLALLVLGACQSFGRTRDAQHRSFIELAHKRGWWSVFKDAEAPEQWMEVLRNWQDNADDALEYEQWMSLFPSIYLLSRCLDKYRVLLMKAPLRTDFSDITRILAPRSDELLTGAGQHFDAPPAPLRIGLHWVIRELVRLEVLNNDDLYKHCWVPSGEVIRLLERTGFRIQEGSTMGVKAVGIHSYLARMMDTENPNMHRAFDVPLRHLAEDAGLQRRLGLGG